MEGFATGFAVEGATAPGFTIENEEFKITFQGVICDESKNIISEGFESCYDWRPVMNLFLQSTDDWDVPVDIEEKTENKLREWLTTFQGWGLLSSILPSLKHRYFILSLAFTSAHWDHNSGGQYSEEKAFEAVKEVYQHVPGKNLASILPKFGIWFEENVRVDFGAERRKNLTLFFNAKWVLEVKFLVEKKRINRNLLELAAESVVQRVRFKDELEQLEIPHTLLSVVREKFKDADWVRTYWSFRNHLESPGSECELEDTFGREKLEWPGGDAADNFVSNQYDLEIPVAQDTPNIVQDIDIRPNLNESYSETPSATGSGDCESSVKPEKSISLLGNDKYGFKHICYIGVPVILAAAVSLWASSKI